MKIIRLTEIDVCNIVMEAITNIIKLNEQMLKSILSESRRRAIYEIDHREATDALCDNMDAKDELRRGNDFEIAADGTIISYFDKRKQTSELIYKRLTQGVVDNVGKNFHLSFGRDEPDESTTEILFFFTEVLLLTDERVVLQGYATMSRSDIPIGKKRPKIIQIDYRFNEQKFYEAVYCKNNTVRDMRELDLDTAGIRGRENIETAKKLVHFLTLCYYSKEDKKTEIASKPPMTGKPLTPFTR